MPNTLAVTAVAAQGCTVESAADLQQARAAARKAELEWLALGQASNVVPQSRLERFVGLIHIPGRTVLDESDQQITLRIGAGEDWHELVRFCVDRGYFGIENLALIPGTVGAAPVQNIGAYGTELAQWLEAVEVVDERGQVAVLAARDCAFAYRASRFQAETNLCISHVRLTLSKVAHTTTSYPDVAQELERAGVLKPSPRDVYAAVVRIRSRKLPDPKRVPNVGSFFKNPLVSVAHAQTLRREFPNLQTYEIDADARKLSAAQLIDFAGWKNRQDGPVRCWHLQPLVITNPGRVDAATILAFADAVRHDVNEKFGVYLALEPSVLS